MDLGDLREQPDLSQGRGCAASRHFVRAVGCGKGGGQAHFPAVGAVAMVACSSVRSAPTNKTGSGTEGLGAEALSPAPSGPAGSGSAQPWPVDRYHIVSTRPR